MHTCLTYWYLSTKAKLVSEDLKQLFPGDRCHRRGTCVGLLKITSSKEKYDTKLHQLTKPLNKTLKNEHDLQLQKCYR